MLGIELIDELVDGAKSAALPLIRGDLGLSYVQVGLLLSLPMIVGSLVELPMGLLADRGWRRSLILLGAAGFVASLLAIAGARTFWMLMAALVLFWPSSGAFVSLTQASLMDLDPDRREANMARWNFAGAAGALLGPLLLAAVVEIGGGWRGTYAALALAATSCAIATWRRPAPQPPAGDQEQGLLAGFRELARTIVRWRVLRWLLLLEASDLMLDVLTGFLAIYLVDARHLSPALAGLAIAIRQGADLLGNLLLIPLLERIPGRHYLRASAALQLLLFPAFMLVPWLPLQLGLLALVSLTSAGWYPVLQAGLYESMPGRSGAVVTAGTALGLAAGLLPAALGALAAAAGVPAALWVMLAAPVLILLTPRARFHVERE